jgi:succinate dehydrogenase flavin-adding protein (antitoxin of CptAB toxin-antitoxin module)
LERVISQYDPKQMADEKSKYIQDGVDNFMQPFHNFTAFGTNPKYVNSPLHNLTPITITEFMNMSPEQKDEYIQFLTLCKNDIYSLVSIKELQMKHGTDPYLKNSQLFRDSVNDQVNEWVKEKYGLDLVDFMDRQNIDWNIFKLRPYFDHDEVEKLNDVGEGLVNIVRNAKNLVGHNKSHRMDQI